MLSIIYITRNRCEELKKSILSCESHISIKHEYVIIDNGSIDDTCLIIESLKDRGLDINFLVQKENLGVSGGRNVGIKSAKYGICYFIDDDASIITDGLCLDRAYFFIKDNPTIFAMGTYVFDTERRKQLIGVLSKDKYKNKYVSRGYIGCSHFINKEFLKEEDLYPNNLVYGSEELYAGLQIYRAGGLIVHYADMKILHEPSQNTRTSRKERQRNGHINTYVIKSYYMSGFALLLTKLFFFLRILRFESFNVKQIVIDYKLSSARFDCKYSKKFSQKQIFHLSKLFGILNIL